MQSDVINLEQSIETLLNQCRRLSNENRTLKEDKQSLLAEKTELKEKNRLACGRLEKIVEKLRSLEDQ